MKHNQDPSAKKGSTKRQIVGITSAGLLAALAVVASADKGKQHDSGQREQGDSKTPAARVSKPFHYNTAPSFESGRGPDGRIDMLAHKVIQHSDGSYQTDPHDYHSYRIDGGTPAPAPTPEPAPENPQK